MLIHMVHALLLHALTVGAHKNIHPVSLPIQRFPEVTMEPTSHHPLGSLKHQQRDSMNTTVNWATMPTYYGFTECAGVNGSASIGDEFLNFSLPCPIVVGTCSSNETAYPCQTYSLECYCGLPLQLNCSWIYTETWFEWMSVEDWFQQQCPSVQPVNFTQIPSCASQCVQNAAFYSGCITSGRNCFCNQESFFGCDSLCDDSDMDITTDWYAQECNFTLEIAGDIIAGNKSKVKGALATPSVNAGIHWYEGIAIATAGLSTVLLVIGWICNPIIRQEIRRRNEKTHAE